ncbi:olfactory receptor 5P68-like [Engystomops pustulosus]|uniref:olfactory receptor 5P68-like n=1 Tax=Engystomops pustulosus TaxID=76066 RepID=UPI003AFA3222
MEDINSTLVTEFILLAFDDYPQFHILLFVVCLVIYITCITGNIIIFLLIQFDVTLHAPMYYFISRFAILEILYVSIIVPKLLDILIAGGNRISFAACFLQLYCADTTGIVVCLLLTVMVFDRHFAITNPLRYMVIMSQWRVKLAIFPWVVGLVTDLSPTILTASLQFCGPNQIDHFYCDVGPLQNLACSDPYISNLMTILAAIFMVFTMFIIIIGFYTNIIITVLKIKTTEGKYKAFSTCSSHLIVACLFFSTATIVYVGPNGSKYEKFFALIYRVVIPLLNPFIYTLRNNDVKLAFFRTLKEFKEKHLMFLTCKG